MKSVRRQTALVLVSVALTSLLASCSDSKVAQCNKLVDVVNKFEPLGQNFEKEATGLEKSFNEAKNLKDVNVTAGQAATTFNKFATQVDESMKELKAIELSDEKLKGFQGRYVKDVDEINQGIRNMAQALDAMSKIKDKPEDVKKLQKITTDIDGATKQLDAASKDSDKVIADLNAYCKGS